jgi:hypothetical protein
MRRLRAFRALPGVEKRQLIQALVLLPLVHVGLRLASLKRVQAALARLAPARPTPADDALPGLIHRAVRTVELAAGHGPYPGNCLRQSLVLWWLLRREGIDGEIRLGVRTEGSRFEAHAWVERLRVPLNDRAGVVSRYVPFDRSILPAGRDDPRRA